ncbi:MAG TPA: type I phosphomannose isomerase catalytic subunit, partial [Arthrobacter sp.]
MYELENVLRPYAWGSTTAIAGLLGRPASGGPEAELWIGAHPDSPSVALSQAGSAGAHAAVADHAGRRALDALIAEDPEHHLGGESVAA